MYECFSAGTTRFFDVVKFIILLPFSILSSCEPQNTLQGLIFALLVFKGLSVFSGGGVASYANNRLLLISCILAAQRH
jgi:hypothetical protein